MSLNRTWYMQLSKPNYIRLTTVMKNNFPGLLLYERGKAKMIITPDIGDSVIVLGSKHKVTEGVIIGTNYDTGELRYLVSLGEINPVPIGIFYRQNWTLVKSERKEEEKKGE